MTGLSARKPKLSFWQIWNMCFGFLGIQVGFALQNANVSRIFQTLGAEVEQLPILWIAAPLTGLLVQPIVGYLSDHTWGRMGRRRPYFLYGAILSTLALLAMPNSPVLWVAVGTLWVMDASINITMEPFRAFVGDMLPDEQCTTGFAMQSFFIGTGAVLASALPWMMANWFGINNVAEAGVIPESVTYAFYIGGAGVFFAVMWTVYSTKEYSPEQLEAFEKAVAQDTDRHGSKPRNLPRYETIGAVCVVAGLLSTAAVAQFGLEKELYIIGIGVGVFGIMQFLAGFWRKQPKSGTGFKYGYLEIMDDLFNMPQTMKQLAVVQFFSWFGLFAMWIYTTAGVTAFHYGTSDPTSASYNNGADWVGVLFAAYNGFAALAAFGIPVLANRTSRKTAHMICLLCGALGLMSFVLIHDPAFLWLPMIGVGIAWASILSVPYSILSGALPYRKMGIYMGIFNFFIVIPQLLAASILGVLVKYLFGGEAIYALALGGAGMVIAALTTLRVEDRSDFMVQ